MSQVAVAVILVLRVGTTVGYRDGLNAEQDCGAGDHCDRRRDEAICERDSSECSGGAA